MTFTEDLLGPPCPCPRCENFTVSELRAYAKHCQQVADEYGEEAFWDHANEIYYEFVGALAEGRIADPMAAARVLSRELIPESWKNEVFALAGPDDGDKN